MKTRDMALCALFAALLAVCAWLTIPLGDVPFTLQTFGVFAALGLLGGKRGTIAIAVYLLLGAIGAFFGPVAVLFTVIVSSFVGSIVGVALILRGKAKLGSKTAVPYGPFLALGVVTWMFWGPGIVNWYLHLHAFAK